jgi:hypothetical protein
MFPHKRYATFFLNILYAGLLLLCVDFLYNLINVALLAAGGKTTLGVGPILFGVFYTGFDLLFIQMKRLFQQILRDAKSAAGKK